MAQPSGGLYVGLISGTSCDGIDAALVRCEGDGIEFLDARPHPYPAPLRDRLLAIPDAGRLALGDLGELDNAVADCFAEAAAALLLQAGLTPDRVRAIGSHGQNVWHAPERAVTMQIGNPSLVAARTGITTVADFRRKDVALGGQGAPLAPALHRALFALPGACTWVLNLGGIANLTRIDDRPLIGFDTGPANALMDGWCQRHTGQAFDRAGEWAARGRSHDGLLNALMADDYFQAAPPKSTGRERFNLGWLDRHLASLPGLEPVDVQRSLLELTARTVTDPLGAAPSPADRLVVCGGGVRNTALMDRIAELAPCPTSASDELGVPADWVEAIAFAWFAARTMEAMPSSAASVTGASRDAVLGGIYLP